MRTRIPIKESVGHRKMVMSLVLIREGTISPLGEQWGTHECLWPQDNPLKGSFSSLSFFNGLAKASFIYLNTHPLEVYNEVIFLFKK